MPVSLEYLDRCARETGYQVATLEKVVRLGELAGEIARRPELKGKLALKGGTAINLGFGAPTRMSVDLDYNYIGSADREAMVAERPGVEAALTDLMVRLGYSVQSTADATAARKFFATYQSVLGPQDRVEVDINYMWRTPLAGVQRVSLWRPGDLDRPEVVTVSSEELWVGKLLALLDRGAPRDAWDVSRMRMIAAELLTSSTFRRNFMAFSVTLPHELQTYTQERFTRGLGATQLEASLLPMLASGDRPTAAELSAKAWAVMEPFLQLTESESAYVSSAFAGKLRLELLYPDDPAAAESIGRHPQLRWKMQNVQTHLAKGR